MIGKQILFCSIILYLISIISTLLFRLNTFKEIYVEGGILSVVGVLFVVYLLNVILSVIFFIPTIVKNRKKS
ncbi:hypothetical protein SAMN04488559_12023 [Isobaculum melis]|uniref:Uncharacterized protein n=1 Tax=Isobaculum melis TaxID=142588 RepID=A0A1H9U2V6_9LACT|nr:hypothetical protein SAMN04488559_12023 [Isobaculum melis]